MSLQKPRPRSSAAPVHDLTLRQVALQGHTVAAEPAGDLTVTVVEAGEVDVVKVVGELDLATSPHLRESLSALVARGRRHLVLDLDGVSFIDSTGLGVLVAAHRRLTTASGSLAVVCHAPRCMRLMEMTGMTRVFRFHDTTDAAVGALASPATATSGG